MKIDGEFLTNLRFADDIFLCTETPQELQQMLQELSDESRRMGHKMNIAKTKVVDNTAINVNDVLIENAICLKRQVYSSYVLRAITYHGAEMRDLYTDQTNTEQTCGPTDQNGKKYAQHHIQ